VRFRQVTSFHKFSLATINLLVRSYSRSVTYSPSIRVGRSLERQEAANVAIILAMRSSASKTLRNRSLERMKLEHINGDVLKWMLIQETMSRHASSSTINHHRIGSRDMRSPLPPQRLDVIRPLMLLPRPTTKAICMHWSHQMLMPNRHHCYGINHSQ
jgi:hypothetical protein